MQRAWRVLLELPNDVAAVARRGNWPLNHRARRQPYTSYGSYVLYYVCMYGFGGERVYHTVVGFPFFAF